MVKLLDPSLVPGVIGPELVTWTMNAWSAHAYVPTYLAAAGVAVLSALVLAGGTFQRAAPAR